MPTTSPGVPRDVIALADQLTDRLHESLEFDPAGLPPLGQLGFVVEDLAQARQRYGEIFGVRVWYGAIIYSVELFHNGERVTTDLAISIGYADRVQIELIEFVDGDSGIFTPNAFAELEGLHHVGIFARRFDKWHRHFSSHGYVPAEHGAFSFAPLSKTRVAYYDLRPRIGLFVELIGHNMYGLPVRMPHWMVRLGTALGTTERLANDPR